MQEGNLSVEIGELELRNPTILAAGILGVSGASLKRVWEAGAGAVIMKSVSREPREGYPGPNVIGTRGGLLNSIGLSNPGIEEALEEVEIAKDAGATVVGSVFGEEAEDFAELAEEMVEAGADAVELNLSCPHAGGLSTIGRSPELTREIVESCNDTGAPVWAKLPGNTHVPSFLEVADAAEEAGADALVLINTIPAMAIDTTARKPVLGNKKGGLSGPAIKPVGLRLVYEAYERVEVPIIGSGGVMTGEDLVEYVLAGASAVEIGTGVLEDDMEIFERVCEQASEHLDGEEIRRLEGQAHED